MKLILLTLALVFFLLAGLPWGPPPIEGWRLRLVACGLAAWVAAQYPFP